MLHIAGVYRSSTVITYPTLVPLFVKIRIPSLAIDVRQFSTAPLLNLYGQHGLHYNGQVFIVLIERQKNKMEKKSTFISREIYIHSEAINILRPVPKLNGGQGYITVITDCS